MNKQAGEELSQVIVNEAVDQMESILKEGQVEEIFEFGNPDLSKGAVRFMKLFGEDREAAVAGMLMASMVTADIFLDAVTGSTEEKGDE